MFNATTKDSMKCRRSEEHELEIKKNYQFTCSLEEERTGEERRGDRRRERKEERGGRRKVRGAKKDERGESREERGKRREEKGKMRLRKIASQVIFLLIFIILSRQPNDSC